MGGVEVVGRDEINPLLGDVFILKSRNVGDLSMVVPYEQKADIANIADY